MTAKYTGDGLRAWKQPGVTGKRYFLYDGTLPIIELNKDGEAIAVNTFGAHGLVSRTEEGSFSTFYTLDLQGSVAQRLDYAGNVLSSHLFAAHGNEVTTASADPFGYGAQWGYYSDRETGLQLLTNRYYDPQAGRFLTRDPIGYYGGINLYAYVRNNPITLIDPSGTQVRQDRNFWPDETNPRTGKRYRDETSGCGCQDIPRLPDFAQLEVDFPSQLIMTGPALQLTYDRNGGFYWSPGTYAGTPGFNVSGGWLPQFNRPNSGDTYEFITEEGSGGMIISPYWCGVGATWSSHKLAPQVAFGTPGVSFSGTYGRHIHTFSFTW